MNKPGSGQPISAMGSTHGGNPASMGIRRAMPERCNSFGQWRDTYAYALSRTQDDSHNPLNQWRNTLLPLVTKLDFEPFKGTPFNASLKLPLGLPGVTRSRFSAGRLVRPPELAKSTEDALQITIIETGPSWLGECRREIQLLRGQATLLHTTEPGYGASTASFGGTSVIVPRAELALRNVSPENAVLQRLTSECEPLQLLKSYLQSLEKLRLHDGPHAFGAPTGMREAAQRHIHDLVALTISWRGTLGESHLSAVAEARLRQALDYIAAHFDDPRLTLDMVACQQGISARYLQRLMTSANHSFPAIVNKMRLQKAFTALTTADQDKRSILDIALQVGFNDISYFNRLFRTQFGDSPSGVRGQNHLRD